MLRFREVNCDDLVKVDAVKVEVGDVEDAGEPAPGDLGHSCTKIGRRACSSVSQGRL